MSAVLNQVRVSSYVTLDVQPNEKPIKGVLDGSVQLTVGVRYIQSCEVC